MCDLCCCCCCSGGPGAPWNSVNFGLRKLTTEAERRRLHRFFATKLDRNRGGTIELHEMLEYFEVEETPLTLALFGYFDADGSGSLTFREFSLHMYNFLTLEKEGLHRFVFRLHDRDCNGRLATNEVEGLVRDAFGSAKMGDKMQKVMSGSDMKKKASLNEDEFLELVRRSPNLLYPIANLQMNMQRRCLGTRFWRRHTKVRSKYADSDA
mmetsp:Transcript_9765/g.33227  ORF Transcript_9765/g.33227 Transcript_9765/m.33227 type:complete len:210 (+) Transcript_9765:160-789(+)